MPEPVASKVGPALAQEHARGASLGAVKDQAHGCQRCDLYRYATQLVFGEGPEAAKLVLVGEQPGDKEDVAGRPFVGPAGAVLAECLREAGVERKDCYLTNAVKHFKYEQRGKRRLHSRPNAGEVQRCAWWLGAELELIRPDVVVALGATAAKTLLGPTVKVMKDRGKPLDLGSGFWLLVTIHPSYLLRIQDREAAARMRRDFVNDLKTAVKLRSRRI